LRLTELSNRTYKGTPNPEIRGLSADSRTVNIGWLFAALPGAKSDGRNFIAAAIEAGAGAILGPPGTVLPPNADGVALMIVDNPRHVFALMAARFYNRQPGTIAAITGTNGKTSTAVFTQQIWQAFGIQAASIGTLGVRAPGREEYGSLTTPDPATLHAELDRLASEDQVTHLAIEASSHGIAQGRLDGVKLSAGAFTNLTRDHLDYHATMEDYFAAKARLFGELLPPGAAAVLNADVPEFETLKNICVGRGLQVIGYGLNGKRLRLVERKPVPGGQEITIEVTGRHFQLLLPLVGSFMAMNALCALGLVMAPELENIERTQAAVTVLASLQGAPGRLQSVSGHPTGAAVYVDYAHTPDALLNTLMALRPHTTGRLVCITGCGGDRDPGKRPIMGSLAVKLADLAIISDDNPRTEDPATIRAAMMAGAPGATEIGGRREAIQWAVGQLQAGDVLVIAGKGHERGQIIGTAVEPFDDVDEAQKAIDLAGGRMTA
jgi:UDP-N-acetylmuramoyl-L-alanyl-D-glutamate--2,6-diaminopimelate ligase